MWIEEEKRYWNAERIVTHAHTYSYYTLIAIHTYSATLCYDLSKGFGDRFRHLYVFNAFGFNPKQFTMHLRYACFLLEQCLIHSRLKTSLFWWQYGVVMNIKFKYPYVLKIQARQLTSPEHHHFNHCKKYSSCSSRFRAH